MVWLQLAKDLLKSGKDNQANNIMGQVKKRLDDHREAGDDVFHDPDAFYKDIDGKLWIGTIGGVTIYDPKEEKRNPVEPQTQINGVRLFLEKFLTY